MELSFGQYASLGPITIWKVSPLFKGKLGSFSKYVKNIDAVIFDRNSVVPMHAMLSKADIDVVTLIGLLKLSDEEDQNWFHLISISFCSQTE